MKTIITLILSITCSLIPSWAQKITLKTDPDPLIVKVGETKKLSIVAVDEQGNILDGGNLGLSDA